MTNNPADNINTAAKKEVYWPRVKEILDKSMEKWIQRWGRQPYPGIHPYYWDSPESLSKCVISSRRMIEPGVPGKDTALVLSLTRGVASTGRMPLRGPFISKEEVDEVIAWIDNGMPKGPEDKK